MLFVDCLAAAAVKYDCRDFLARLNLKLSENFFVERQ